MEGVPEQQYEDSAQKADRLLAEFEKQKSELNELHELGNKDREAEMAIFSRIDALHEEHHTNLIALQEETNKANKDILNRFQEQVRLAQELVAHIRQESSKGKDFVRDESFADQVDGFTSRINLIGSEVPLVEADFKQKLFVLEADWTEKLSALHSDLAGIQGDLKGTRSLFDSSYEKILELVRQLKEMGEIEGEVP